jgi:IS605 OrfB family transposase
VSGRAVRAECRQHLRDRKGRSRAAARRAPGPGQRGSRRWRRHRRRQRTADARHQRRVRQAQHEAAKQVISWAVGHRVGTLAVGDPRGILDLKAGRRHSQRTRDWRIGHLITVLRDKAEAAGIAVKLVDERGTSSTCPSCSRRVPKPAGRVFSCPHCGHGGHRDLVAAASIAARGGGTIPANIGSAGITHRRAGTHLPGVHPARRDPRRRPPSRPAATGHLAGTGPPRPAPAGREVARPRRRGVRKPAGQPPTNLRTGALSGGASRCGGRSGTSAGPRPAPSRRCRASRGCRRHRAPAGTPARGRTRSPARSPGRPGPAGRR